MATDTATRAATLVAVDLIITHLVDAGLTYEQACKQVRWAAHVIEGRHS